MALLNDNPGQGNRGGQEYGEEGTHKSQRNQDNQPTNTTSEEKALRPEEEVPSEDKKRDKFSPGEADNYNPEEFATD